MSATDPLDLARRLVASLDGLRAALPPLPGGIGDRVTEYLGDRLGECPGVVERFPASERANIEVALRHLFGDPAGWTLLGLPADVGNYGGFSLVALASGRFGGHVGEQPVEFAQLPIDVDEHLECFRTGILLVEVDGVPVVVLVFEQHHMQPEVVVEIVAGADDVASRLLVDLKAAVREHNVFRGKVLSFGHGRHGEFGIEFVRVPRLARDDVILAPGVLEAVESHTVVLSRHAAALREAGQDLRRGLLLFGPPGTGKTHTVMYLCNELPGRTVLLLTGPALHAIGQAGSLARELAPAMIVIEDVDLIGMDRGLPGGEHNPLLFQLLNEMDGLAPDRDVIFVLTTNRVDLLEPALAARPGRVDSAVEIGLPDADARRRLLALYLPDGPVPEDIVDAVVARTDRAAAAFVKELARRAVLLARVDGTTVADALLPSLDDMIEHTSPIMRRSLGLDTD